MINVIAIDDEPLALLQLQKMIEQTPYFTLVAACPNAFEALKVIEDNPVDAIFTDINMPDLSGLDFTRLLSGNPIIVFTTAYSQYAIDGYKANAIDYLLKPFGQPEFMRVAMKVKKQYDLIAGRHSSISSLEGGQEGLHQYSIRNLPSLSTGGAGGGSPQHPVSINGDTLFVKTDYRIVRISMSDILYVESQSEYLKIHLASRSPLMVLMSVKRLAELLPADTFVRIHRSYIVNMNHLKEISRMKIYIDPDIILPIGESFRDDVLKFINGRLIGKEMG